MSHNCSKCGTPLICPSCRSAKGGKTTAKRHAKKLKEWGRKGGKVGGRPGNPEIKSIMAERGVSRQRAHQILKERRLND